MIEHAYTALKRAIVIYFKKCTTLFSRARECLPMGDAILEAGLAVIRPLTLAPNNF